MHKSNETQGDGSRGLWLDLQYARKTCVPHHSSWPLASPRDTEGRGWGGCVSVRALCVESEIGPLCTHTHTLTPVICTCTMCTSHESPRRPSATLFTHMHTGRIHRWTMIHTPTGHTCHRTTHTCNSSTHSPCTRCSRSNDDCLIGNTFEAILIDK